MRVSSLPASILKQQLTEIGIYLQIGPLVVHLRSPLPTVAEGVHLLYGDFLLLEPGFADFHVSLDRPHHWRRWYRPQVEFSFDGYRPFKPLPLSQAFPMFEWTLNWCVANHIHQYLIIHSAVIEKNGYAAILPGAPGVGKSTLCAALVARGWRLLSDEMALLKLDGNGVLPIPRPISLKNKSIDIIRSYAPQEVIGPLAIDTHKGTVAHMKPPESSIRRLNEPAQPAWVILPQYVPGPDVVLNPVGRGEICLRLAENSFNYNVLGARGFEALTAMLDHCHCYKFQYSQLDDALRVFNALEPPR